MTSKLSPKIPHHECKFILDKANFAECYQESVEIDNSLRAYFKAIFFIVFGAVLVLFTDINTYVSTFIFALGVVEALSVYYQKPWWVMRQLLSKVAQSEITLTIDDKGIHIRSYYSSQDLLWENMKEIHATSLGWIIHHPEGKTYLSNSHLSKEVQAYLATK